MPAYSGVQMSSASTAAIAARSSATGAGSGSVSWSGLKCGRVTRPR